MVMSLPAEQLYLRKNRHCSLWPFSITTGLLPYRRKKHQLLKLSDLPGETKIKVHESKNTEQIISQKNALYTDWLSMFTGGNISVNANYVFKCFSAIV